jgi:type I restriction enzyme, S subunit
MNATQLLAHFDRLAEAPNAVPRLRRFILDLAVRGKLVEQDAGDEPAVELLKRIRAEKAGLIKAGKLKRGAVEARAADSEPQFVIPMNWIWAQLGEVAQYGISDKVDSNAAIPANTWILDLEDIEKDTSRLLNQVESEERPFSSTKTAFKQSDVLFGKLRPYLNKVIVADRDGVCTTEIIPIRGYCGLAPEYTKLVLRSPLTMATVNRLMYGMKMPRLGTADAAALNYPLPPLAEQHRIVAKVDELMALCDQLEAAQQERERRRDRLAAASLQRLNQPALDVTPEAQREHAGFHLQHLPRLTTRPEHIKAMRQTILNLAVRGKLVEQDAEDESAAELLQRIKLSTTQPVTSGKPKKVKPLSLIAIQEEPYPAPMGWSWVRMGLIGETNIGLTYSPANLANAGTPVLRSSNIQNGKLDLSDLVRVNVEVKESVLVQEGDLLICARNGSKALVGKTALISGLTEKMAFGAFMAIFRSPYNAYLLRFINSPLFRAMISDVNTTTINQITQENLKSALLPLPPLNEQHRIVAKVDELMALCDQFEAQLTSTQTDSRRLLEAVLEAALIPVN